MTSSLSQFQRAFIAALYAGDDHELPEVTSQPGFAVYRNTVIKSCVDALQANFPSVVSVVGETFFRAMATEYVRQTPPHSVELLRYGQGHADNAKNNEGSFATFISEFPPAALVAYLVDIARVDSLWLEVFSAQEDSSLDLIAPGLTIEELAQMKLSPKAAVRWYWSDAWPIYSLWNFNREQISAPHNLRWQAEGILLYRYCDRVIWEPIGAGGCAFLEACQCGKTVEEASLSALVAEPLVDFSVLFTRLLQCKVFTPYDKD
ncbi:putative DNA-binding domain-containing protein [Rouxiella sp. Mn2063]|uniref:HvfC/BufC family peptide modification chaperone n=1 Tax=Rouxiella sp. Mn2063 TaxID=3395262 RepID=UPI003BDA7EC3